MTTASIHAQANDPAAQAELAAWASFSSPQDTADFWRSWLAILCPQIAKVSSALLVLGPDEQGGYSAAAVWPDIHKDLQYLGATAETTLKERRGIVDHVVRERRRNRLPMTLERRREAAPGASAPKAAFVGYPIEVSGALRGAVILDIANPSEQELQRAMRLLHWASAWLIDQFRQQELSEHRHRLHHLSIISDLAATAVQTHSLGASALAVANEIAIKLRCDRVSMGFERSGSIEVKTLSNTAKFDKKTNLVRSITDAMDEVLDLDTSIVFPASDDDLELLAHAELAAQQRDVAICSVPLMENGVLVGVMTLERSSGDLFSDEDIALCKACGLMLGPILWLKLQNERSALKRLRESCSHGLQALFGPRHPGVKLIALCLIGLTLFLSFYRSEYRVSSKAVIEGEVQRAISAPFDGYIAEGAIRAGDTVSVGQVLARLDDRDLKLDRVRWLSEREQSERKFRQALAEQDRTAMSIARAQVDQAQVQLNLAEEKLTRATLVAPFDGVVVSGDLSQMLGSPVEQGKVLYEIAPLDSYRVILNVDERDISQVSVGLRGSLALSGIPYETIPFAVKQVTPVSTAEDGKNFFRVEAQLDGPVDRLRPGMEGVGKVTVGERKLIWIMTHSLVDWFRLWSWTWMP